MPNKLINQFPNNPHLTNFLDSEMGFQTTEPHLRPIDQTTKPYSLTVVMVRESPFWPFWENSLVFSDDHHRRVVEPLTTRHFVHRLPLSKDKF